MRALLAAAALLLPLAAGAQPALSLRLGYASPFGSAADALPMSQVVRGQIPIQADALFRLGSLAAGAYASWGPGFAGGCDRGARCTASSLRLGVEGIFTFRPPSASFDAWGGAGFGYEWTTRRRDGAGGEVEWTYRGWEWFSLQGGADVLRAGRAAFGPFVLLAVGRYGRLAVDTPAASGGGVIAGGRFHAWLELGVRAKLDL
jgi:hypothetical protein